jgi:hypothetical protein
MHYISLSEAENKGSEADVEGSYGRDVDFSIFYFSFLLSETFGLVYENCFVCRHGSIYTSWRLLSSRAVLSGSAANSVILVLSLVL